MGELDTTLRPVAPAASGDGLPGPGDRIGRWQVEALLGQGGCGLVCAARDGDGRAVTLKLPKGFVVGAPGRPGEADELLRREAEVLERVRHPNVIAAHGLEKVEGRAVLLLEPIEGESLAARLGRDRAGERDAGFDNGALTALLRDLAEGLEAVHAAGYLHGDVKPANLFIRPDGGPLLADFGAAEPRAEGGRGEIGQATPGYAAIEQYQSDGREGPWSDLYGLCAVAYRIVTGRPPPPAPSRAAGEAMSSAARIGHGRYAPALLEAIDRGLTLDPEGRPRSLSAWLETLEDGRPPATLAAAPAQSLPEDPPPKAAVVSAPPDPVALPISPRDVAPPPPPAPCVPEPAATEPPPSADPAPSPLPDSPGPEPVDDLPPTERVVRRPVALDAELPQAGVAPLRAERRERTRAAAGAGRSSLGFLAVAVALAVLGFGGWEGYLRFIKSEWRVDPAGGGDAATVAEALLRARDGATLYLAPGRYAESIVLNSPVNLVGPENPETPAVIQPPAGPCLLSKAAGASISRLVLVRPAAAESPTAGGAALATAPDGGPCVVIAESLRVEDSQVSSAAGPAVVIRDGADPALTRVSVGDAAGAGIIVEGGARGTIGESTIRASAKSGILVRGGAAPTVTGSRIEASGQAGILLAGGGGLFEGNEIVGSAASAVEVREGADPELRGNRLAGSQQAGLYVYDGGLGRFADNEIEGNGFSGVVVAAEGAPALTGNRISGNGEHGIALLDGGGGQVVGNQIADNKGHGIVRAQSSTTKVGDNRLSGNQAPQLQIGRLPGG